MENIDESAVVIETDGKTATVQMTKSSLCAHCSLNCTEKSGSMISEAENEVGAQVGDRVRLATNDKVYLNSVLLVLGLPILGLLIGAVVTSMILARINYPGNQQLLSLAVGAVLFLIAFIPARIYDRRMKKSGKCGLVVLQILDKASNSLPARTDQRETPIIE